MKVTQRKTQQRGVVLQVLTEAGRPLSPQEILDAAREIVPSLGIATVYRNVKTLVESGVLQTVELPGSAQRYEVAGKHHHHHFYCNSCDKVYEIEGCTVGMNANLPQDFEVDDHVVVLYGRCSDCSVGGTQRESKPAAEGGEASVAVRAQAEPEDEHECGCVCGCHADH